MEDFEKYVKNCSDNNSEDIIKNASIEHAKILFKYLLESAKKNERILLVTGKLEDSFYSELVEDFKRCLEKEVSFQILVLEAGAELSGNKLYKELRKYPELVKLEIKAQTETYINPPHFILVGDDRFRLEVNNETKRALASFNSPIAVSQLRENFGPVVSRTIPYAI